MRFYMALLKMLELLQIKSSDSKESVCGICSGNAILVYHTTETLCSEKQTETGVLQ